MCRFPVKAFDVRVADRSFAMVGPADPDAMLDDPQLEEAFNRDGYMPYWADLWPASRMLADFLLREPPPGDDVVIELGCGLGLAGIALAATGRRVHLTDYEPNCPGFALSNARRNGLTGVQAFLLDFRRPPPRQYELAIGSDILYENRLRELVPEFLCRLLRPGGRAVLADPDRPATLAMLRANRLPGLSAAGRPWPIRLPDGKSVEGTVWELVRT
jgi:predicted nicotinamide N-methyase